MANLFLLFFGRSRRTAREQILLFNTAAGKSSLYVENKVVFDPIKKTR
jgi:hypothetical protein